MGNLLQVMQLTSGLPGKQSPLLLTWSQWPLRWARRRPWALVGRVLDLELAQKQLRGSSLGCGLHRALPDGVPHLCYVPGCYGHWVGSSHSKGLVPSVTGVPSFPWLLLLSRGHHLLHLLCRFYSDLEFTSTEVGTLSQCLASNLISREWGCCVF